MQIFRRAAAEGAYGAEHDACERVALKSGFLEPCEGSGPRREVRLPRGDTDRRGCTGLVARRVRQKQRRRGPESRRGRARTCSPDSVETQRRRCANLGQSTLR